jgi:Leucine-rich repeat (LRR) protein
MRNDSNNNNHARSARLESDATGGPKHQSKRQQAAAWAAQRNQQSNTANGANQVSLRMRAARTSGKLDLTGLSLNEIPAACFDAGGGALDGDEDWWALAEITAFVLRDNEITALHPLITNYASTLQVLDCANNSISVAPRECFDLPLLRKLVLTRNRLRTLDLSIAEHLTSLAIIQVSENELQQLPVGTFPGLLVLDASKNEIGELAGEFLNGCERLQRLHLANNRITYVAPNTFDQLTQLTELDLSHNNLTQLEGDLSVLQALQTLDLSYNKLEWLGRLPQGLDQCMLAFNRLSSLEGLELHNLSQLSTLNISDNKIEELPESVGLCAGLKALDAGNNDMRTLPSSLGYLAQLTRISLQGNPLKTIRRSLVEGGTEDLKRYLRTRGGAAQPADGGRGGGEGEGVGGVHGSSSFGSVMREAKATGLLSLSRNKTWQDLPTDVSEMLVEDSEMQERLIKVRL